MLTVYKPFEISLKSVCIQAGVTKDGFDPDTSEENLRWALDVSLKALDGKKTIDLFQCARVDKTVPLEETYKLMKQFQEQGKFTHIGISEVGSETLTKVMKVRMILPSILLNCY